MNYTQIVSQEDPERELSSVELHSTTSDSQTASDPLSRDYILSRSSVLSEEWCRSVLGKPCTNVRVYSKGSNPLYRKEYKQNDQGRGKGTADNIGNLFGKGDEDRPKLPVPKCMTPKVKNSLIVKPDNQQKPVVTENLSGKDPLINNQLRESRGTLGSQSLSPENSQGGIPFIEKDRVDKISRENKLSDKASFPQEDTIVSNHRQNPTSSRGSQYTDNKAEINPEQITDIVRRDKGVPNLNTPEGQIERSNSQLLCYCDDDSQTSPPSILKRKPISKSDPVFSSKQRNRKTWTGRNMDSYPEKDYSPRSPGDRHKIVLTSDKVQQTSDDSFLDAGGHKTTACSNTNRTETSINTFNSELARVQTASEMRSSLSPEEEYHVWHCSGATMGHLCKCSPTRLRSPRRQSSFCSPSVSPRTVDSYRTDRTSKTPKKQPAKHIRGMSEERGCNYCVPPSYRGCPNYPCQQALRHKNLKQSRREHHPERRMVTVVPCDGSCRRYLRKPDICIDYQPVPCRLPPPYPSQFEFSSSEDDDEEDEEDDDDANTSESCLKHSDLPYQNNEEYLELVQELEETLQSRNRNRVNRAMKEFEHKSKFNRPLERPIINYGEASESEEPIMKKISEFTEKRRNCKGDCYSCRKTEVQDRKPRPPRMKSPTTKPWKNPKLSPGEYARWQMDDNSGEWFKICHNSPKCAPPSMRSPKKEHSCGCACSCGR